MFTLFSVYGTINALVLDGNWVALSHAGQILAGLFAGVKSGFGIGAIIAVYLLVISNGQLIISAICALFAGLIAGLYQLWKII